MTQERTLHFSKLWELLDFLMKRTLDLGQTSMSEHQFQAFRKMVMDVFAEEKRGLLGIDKGRCGVSKSGAKEGVIMDG